MAAGENHCQFYLTKKKRFCRFAPKPNATYCPEHACVMGFQEDRKRIPCPLNPNHNCYEDELQRHLKRCNVTKNRQAVEKLPYFVKDINQGSKDDCKNNVVSTMRSVKDLTSDKLKEMIAKVNKLYTVVGAIERLYLEHSRIKEEVAGDLDLAKSFGDQAVLRKEMLQQASLVGQLENQGLLSSGHHFVELGAGKGKLSHWIHKASEECTDKSFLLVERGSVRYKVDPYHKHDKAREQNFQRIKIDIQDLCLGKVPGIESKESIVVVGKHLCGGATDLGIRCAVDSLRPLCQNPSGVIHTSNQLSPKSGKNISPPETNCRVEPINSNQETSLNVEHSATISKQEEATTRENPAEIETTGSQDSEQSGTSSSLVEENIPSSKKKCDSQLDAGPPSKVARVEEDIMCSSKLQGIMIALCCHHRCTWNTYVGREFMRRHEINEEEFDLLTRLSSWATCARTRVRGKTSSKKVIDEATTADPTEDENKATIAGEATANEEDKSTKGLEEEEEHNVEDLIGVQIDDNTSLREKLSVSEREMIGRKAKRIIDMGRIEYLRSRNMDCFLREYISDTITPENIVLIATAQKNAIS